MREYNLLSQFKTEVIDAGIESTLPYNLTDKWMDILTLEAEDFFSEDSDSTGGIILLAVVHILVARNRNRGGSCHLKNKNYLTICKLIKLNSQSKKLTEEPVNNFQRRHSKIYLQIEMFDNAIVSLNIKDSKVIW